MADRRSITRDMNLLLGDLPNPETPLADRAAWFERKAGLLDRLAEHTATPPTRAEVKELAERARVEARRLRICIRLTPRGGAWR
jgi:hypothetical protein